MSTYRPYSTNRLHFGSVLRFALVAAFLAGAGLSFLYLKHQLHVAGNQKKSMEKELQELSQQSRVLDSQIAALTSRAALQGRLKDGFIHMVEIPNASIVRIRLLPEGGNNGLAAAASGVNADALRPVVSHEGRSVRAARQ